MNREIVLDTETTGLDPMRGDRVVEIGCVELINHIPTGKHLHLYVNPERDMPPDAFRVHGLSEAFLADKPLFVEVADALLDFIAEAPLIIHNAGFDIGFLNAELERCGRSRLTNAVIDTVTLARTVHPGARVNLDALCKHYGIDNSRRTLHGALLDSEILAEVYLELIGGRQVGLQFGGEPKPQAGMAPVVRAPARQRPSPLPPRLGEAELAAHRELISSFGEGAVWMRYAAIETELRKVG